MRESRTCFVDLTRFRFAALKHKRKRGEADKPADPSLDVYAVVYDHRTPPTRVTAHLLHKHVCDPQVTRSERLMRALI